MSSPDADRRRLFASLATLVACRTENPPGNETVAADLLAAEMAAAGFRVSQDEIAPGRGNVVGVLDNGNGPRLAFCSHTDTVPVGEGWSGDPFELRHRGDHLVGRGACDAKGQVASMLEAGRLLAQDRERWRGRLTLAFVADEEIGGAGAVAVAAAARGIDRVVIGEPTGLQLMAAHKGVVRPKVRVHGRSAHSGTPDRGVNAITAAMRLIDLLGAEDRRLRQQIHHLVGPASLSVTRIFAGIADNIIPPACDLTLDRRMLPGETFAEVDAQIAGILAAAKAERQVDAEVIGHTSRAGPAEIAVDDPLAVAALEASHRHARAVMPPGGFLGGCDLFHFDSVGIKGLVMGPGDLAQAHTPDEWIDADELVLGALVYRDLALDWFRRVGASA